MGVYVFTHGIRSLEEDGSRSRVARFIELNISNLAAVPSIIYGLLGLGLFVRLMSMGQSVMAGAATLALAPFVRDRRDVLAQAVQAAVKQSAGIDLNVALVDQGTATKALTDGEYEVFDNSRADTDAGAALNLLLHSGGAINRTGLDDPRLDKLLEEYKGKLKVVSTPQYNAVTFISMNNQIPPFDNVNVRRAIGFALPYDDMFVNERLTWNDSCSSCTACSTRSCHTGRSAPCAAT